MTTALDYARSATAAVQNVLHLSPDDFDAEGTALAIEQAIRNATDEAASSARRELEQAQAAAGLPLRGLQKTFTRRWAGLSGSGIIPTNSSLLSTAST